MATFASTPIPVVVSSGDVVSGLRGSAVFNTTQLPASVQEMAWPGPVRRAAIRKAVEKEGLPPETAEQQIEKEAAAFNALSEMEKEAILGAVRPALGAIGTGIKTGLGKAWKGVKGLYKKFRQWRKGPAPETMAARQRGISPDVPLTKGELRRAQQVRAGLHLEDPIHKQLEYIYSTPAQRFAQTIPGKVLIHGGSIAVPLAASQMLELGPMGDIAAFIGGPMMGSAIARRLGAGRALGTFAFERGINPRQAAREVAAAKGTDWRKLYESAGGIL